MQTNYKSKLNSYFSLTDGQKKRKKVRSLSEK